MAIRNVASDRPYSGRYLVMVECPICGAKRGEGFNYFAWHLWSDHDASEVGLDGVDG
jgi:hypothetical protein